MAKRNPSWGQSGLRVVNDDDAGPMSIEDAERACIALAESDRTSAGEKVALSLLLKAVGYQSQVTRLEAVVRGQTRLVRSLKRSLPFVALVSGFAGYALGVLL